MAPWDSEDSELLSPKLRVLLYLTVYVVLSVLGLISIVLLADEGTADEHGRAVFSAVVAILVGCLQVIVCGIASFSQGFLVVVMRGAELIGAAAIGAAAVAVSEHDGRPSREAGIAIAVLALVSAMTSLLVALASALGFGMKRDEYL